jgi:hypothetical protein
LLRVRRNRAQGLALVLDVDTFTGEDPRPSERSQHELALQILRENQWRVIEVPSGMSVADAWSALEQLSAVG